VAVLKFTALGGIEPSVPARALADNGAQLARNINPGSPTFRPLLGDEVVATSEYASPQTLYRFDRNPDGTLNTNEAAGWKTNPGVLNLVHQQLNDDVTGKIYYTPADGSAPMRWHNAAGTDRQVGVPAPTAAPTIDSINDSYVFTQDVRGAELRAVLAQAERIVLANCAPAWAGPDTPLPEGWVRSSDFVQPSDPRYAQAQREVLRVFALRGGATAGSAIANTFSAMPPAEAAWVLDPTLGGETITLNGTEPVPAWAAGYTRFWCIPARAFAQVYDLDAASIRANLLLLKMPGTQGAQPLLSAAQADAIVLRLQEHGDKDGARVGPLIAALRAKIFNAAEIFTAGGKVNLADQTADFYRRLDVQASLQSAVEVFAEAIWGMVRSIGVATTKPYYNDFDSGGGA